MFPLRFRLCQKGKEYKINTWNFFIPNFGIFIPNFPLALPSSADWLSWWQGCVSEPLQLWSVEQNVGTRVGVGERPQHTGAPAKPNHISSGHWPPFLGTYCPPEEYPKLFHYTLINPGLSALGKVTLFIKMPLWVSFKKKNCSTMVICIQRKKKSGVHCPVTKKIRGTHTYTPPPNLIFSVLTLALC